MGCPAVPKDDHEKMRNTFMLTMTEKAVIEIRDLTELPEAPQGGGVRIASDQTAGGLAMTLAATPADDDTVLDSDRARLFLDITAATLLDDKTLDAVANPNGQTQFAIVEQST